MVRPGTFDRAGSSGAPKEEQSYAAPSEENGEKTEKNGVSWEQYLPKNTLLLVNSEEKGVILRRGERIPRSFQHASIQAERDGFLVITFPFIWNGEEIGQMSRILPTESMSAGRLFLSFDQN